MAGVLNLTSMTAAERARLLRAAAETDTQAIDGLVAGQHEGEEGETERNVPWYVRPMQAFVYVFAYSLLAAGWLLTHVGQAMTWLGHEAKEAARSID